MIGTIITIIISSIIITAIIIYNKKKRKEEITNDVIQQIVQQEKEKIKKETDAEIEYQQQRLRNEIAVASAEAKNAIAENRQKQLKSTADYEAAMAMQQALLAQKQHDLQIIIDELEQRKKDLEQAYQDQVANEKKRKEKELLDWETLRIFKLDQEYDKHKQELIAKTEAETAAFIAQCEEKKTQIAADLSNIESTLNEYKKKRQVINEEILRQRAIEEQQDFYRIVLTDQDKEDIHYLLSIINNIKNKQLLYKLIWSEYIQKSFSGTLKRVLEGKEPRCVIYKITNLKTQEIYIGKTKAEVSKRWTEHVKTSLNIGTIARSKIHVALFGHWDEFSFEVLEKVEDESQLSAREKFYINFYQSNIYGYNMNSGG